MRTRTNAGFTLVELIVVTTISSIVGLVAGFVLLEASRVHADVSPALEATYEADLAVTRIKHEVRELQEAASITAMEPTRFSFTNRAGAVLEFETGSGELRLDGAVLARGVSDFRFDYWDRAGAATTDPATLHLVEVDLTVERVGRPFRFRTAVFPRCLAP